MRKTDQKTWAAIVADLKKGELKATAIGRRHGVSRQTVVNIAKAEDLYKPAPEKSAQVTDARERRLERVRGKRLEEMEELVDVAKRLRLQLFSPHTVYNFGGKDNTFETAEISEPDTKAKADLMRSIDMALNRSMLIERHDTEEEAGVKAAIVQLVDKIMGEAPS